MLHTLIIVHCTVHTRRALCCSTKPLYIVPQTTNPTGGTAPLRGGGECPLCPPPAGYGPDINYHKYNLNIKKIKKENEGDNTDCHVLLNRVYSFNIPK